MVPEEGAKAKDRIVFSTDGVEQLDIHMPNKVLPMSHYSQGKTDQRS